MAVLLSAVAFSLACYRETDNDIWWHLAGGDWILREGRVPDLDPFTFASADRQWIDLHWLFEVAVALIYRAAAMPGVIVFSATLSAATIAVALTMPSRSWPMPVVMLCWAPALMLMGWRLPPRPELCSLVFLSTFLAVMHRLPRQPRLAWLLPVVQVLWVNTHALFVLGLVVLALFLAASIAEELWRRWKGGEPTRPDGWWRIVGPASGLVVVGCLANPYLFRGALFPLELFPKIAASENVFKQTIGEFTSLIRWAQQTDLPATRSLYFCVTYFLYLLLPVSFLLPATWRAWQSDSRRPTTKTDQVAQADIKDRAWLGLLVVAVVFAGLSTLALPGRPVGWWSAPGRYVPIGWLVLGAACAIAQGRREPATTSLLAFAAMAAWTVTLRGMLFGRDDLLGVGGTGTWLMAAVASVSGGIVLWKHGACMERVLFTLAFGYLGMQAMRNAPLFGLATGGVLAANVGQWTGELINGRIWRPRYRTAGRLLNLAIAGALAFWIFAVATDRYHGWTRQLHFFGFDEAPFVSAHAAARFAGQPELPKRAVCFNLGQAGVYSFHNGPEYKPFIDARLELLREADFRRYLALQSSLTENRGEWPAMLAELGEPLLLLLHNTEYAAETSLLAHRDWRCIYFDAAGAVFVSRRLRDLEDKYPTVNFAERHFRRETAEPRAALQEAGVLYRIDRRLATLEGRRRYPLWLAALGRSVDSLKEQPDSSTAWKLAADCYASFAERENEAASDGEPSVPHAQLIWAQAAYCAQRALGLPRRDPDALATLYSIYRSRGLLDAQLSAGLSLMHDPWTTAERRAEIVGLQQSVEQTMKEHIGGATTTAQVLEQCVASGLPLLAVKQYAGLEPADVARTDWQCANAAATAYLQLGRPAEARNIWKEANNVPSEPLRQCRIAETYLVEQQFATGIEQLQQMVVGPQAEDAWYDLVLAHAVLGDEAPLREALEHARTRRSDALLAELADIVVGASTPPRIESTDE
ncbi:MAG TPA: hypothetical protein VG826_24970 [Pirellulales bacterium]|nr:hypothetical protein [Pirellulales bacterium]